jgi:large subunit ribosomal protein L16
MLEPKKTKYRKQQRGRMKGKATRGNTITFGEYALVALEPAWITARQIEASRVAVSHTMKKGGKMWVRIFPDKPVTKKPAETRMGKGKGVPEYWVCVVKPGRILLELEGMSESEARHLLRLAGNKLPIKTRFLIREPGIKYEGF